MKLKKLSSFLKNRMYQKAAKEKAAKSYDASMVIAVNFTR